MTMVFEEEQYFRSRWFWVVIILIVAVQWVASGMLLTLPGLLTGERAGASGQLYLTAAIMLIMSFVLPFLFWKLRLRTHVDATGIQVGFQFQNRTIKYDEIASAYQRRYKPLREYGGWGVRWSRKHGRAYNVSGDEGVQLELTDGRKLLIGSQRAAELERAIRYHMERR